MKNVKSNNKQKYTKFMIVKLGLTKTPKSKHGVVIHCSDSPQGRGDDAYAIDRWHKERGWTGIGYHYVILENGDIQTGRKRGRSGAHAKGYNHYTGICLIGIDYFTEAQYESLKRLILALDTPAVLAHYSISSKTCPNFNVEEFMKRKVRTEIINNYGFKPKDESVNESDKSEALDSIWSILKRVYKS